MEHDGNKYHNVTVVGLYKEDYKQDMDWRESNSFSRDNLPVVKKI